MLGRTTPRCRGVTLAIAAAIAALTLAACGGGSKSTSSGQLPPPADHAGPETIFTAGSALAQDPAGTAKELHSLGVDRVRIFLHWGEIAPDGTSRHRPRFDATDPAAYPAAHWAVYDTMIRDVLAAHMGVDVVLGPNPPLWASAPGAAGPGPPSEHPYWKPNPRQFGQFVRAAGTRYSGHYTPHGQSTSLPRVDFWSIWNEPNLGVQLAPQTTQGVKVEVSPRYYRALADAAWTGLQRTGHGRDTTLIGELAPVGQTTNGKPGNYSVMVPLRFLRALYCVGSDYKPLSGSAATVRGCPAGNDASKRFSVDNPVLFKATAFASHPYSFGGLSPGTPVPDQPDDADLPQIGGLFSALDKVQRAYGSSTRFKVWSTEYGYQTSPPGTQTGLVSPAKAALWNNWAEYLTWRQPRLVSYDQYLLNDPPPVPGRAYTGFASGIQTYSGKRKPGWYAFRMPVWLPKTSATKGTPLEVWGNARPARNVPAGSRPPIAIQWRAKSRRAWQTVGHATPRTASGYVDVTQRFPGSGDVRLSWTPPHGPTIHSRVTAITIR